MAGQGSRRKDTKRRLAEAEARLRRHQAAIEVGADPAALVGGINQAHSAREAARAELANAEEINAFDEAELYAMIDSLGDVGAVIKEGKPETWSVCTRTCDCRCGTSR
jgi:hypothetical protein